MSYYVTIFKGVLSGVVGRFLGLISPFIIMPYLYDYLGNRQFGLWSTLTGITSMAAFIDLGVGSTLLTRLSYSLGRNDYISVRRYIASAYIVVMSIFFILLIMTVVSSYNKDMFNLLLNTTFDDGDIKLIISFVLAFAFSIPASIVHRIYYAKNEIWISSLFQFLGSIFSVVVCLLLIENNRPVWEVVFSYTIGQSVVAVGATALLFTQNRQIRPFLIDIKKEFLNDMIVTGSNFSMLSILTTVSLNVDSVIIANRIGIDGVAQFSPPAKLGSLLMLLITTIFLPMWTVNGDAIARGDYEWIRVNARRMSLLGAAAIAIISVAIVFLGSTIMRLWMHHQFQDQNFVIAAIGAVSVTMALTTPYSMVLNSFGNTRPQLHAWALFLILTIPVKYYLVANNTLWWPPLLSAIGYLIIIFPIMYKASIDNLKERSR